ncbi:MAG: septum formation initiator family protein [Flavobacteriales bacterium]|nr:septum formation initiator family protein [Flavobacteriales bacterium]
MLKKIPHWLKNKYAVTLLFFLVWVAFIDQNNLITQFSYRSLLNEQHQEKAYFNREIEKTRRELNELTQNPKSLEKFAREKYFMKKDEEEIFLFTVK